MPYKLKKSFLEDAWKIVNNMINTKQKISTGVFNHLIECHGNLDEIHVAEEKILPMMNEHALKPNSQTYEVFIKNFD